MTKHEIDLLFIGGAIGFGIGAVGMYFACEQKFKTKYAQIADDEIEQIKDHYRMKEMDLLERQKEMAEQRKPTLDEIAKRIAIEKDIAEADAIVEANKYAEEDEEPEEVVTAFPVLTPWDLEREMASRSKEAPYIIHQEEFLAADSYDHQVTLTYFEGDDVLIDETDERISNVDAVVGLDNVTKFGYGSNDPNVVYIRNDRLQQDMEVLRHNGHYAKEILGLEEETEIEHSAIPRRRRRFDDDG